MVDLGRAVYYEKNFSFRKIKDGKYELGHPYHKIREGSHLNDTICKSIHPFIQHLLSSSYVQGTVLFHGDNVSTIAMALP